MTRIMIQYAKNGRNFTAQKEKFRITSTSRRSYQHYHSLNKMKMPSTCRSRMQCAGRNSNSSYAYQQRSPSHGMRHHHHQSKTNTKMPVGLPGGLCRLGNKSLFEDARESFLIKPTRILVAKSDDQKACNDNGRILPSRKVVGAQHHQIMEESSKPIPLPPSHIHRTRSELQLETDQSIAELRESAMFRRLADGMAEKRKGLDFIFHNHQASSKPCSHRQVDHRSLCDLKDEEVSDLSSVLRRASELCYANTDGPEEEDSGVDEGIFLMDDL